MHEALPWLVCWALRAGTGAFCPALAVLVGQYKRFFSSPYTILIHFSASPSKPGWQSCMVACLLICVSGFYLRCYSFFLADAIIGRYCENRMSFRLDCAFLFMQCHLELTNFPFRKHYTKRNMNMRGGICAQGEEQSRRHEKLIFFTIRLCYICR